MTDALAWGYVAAGNQNFADAQSVIQRANNTIDRLNARALVAEAELTRVRDMLVIAQCNIEGLVAQRTAFKTQHPNSPLMGESGHRFQSDGVMKPVVRLIFERAFDNKGAELKISNPASRREN